ncbi:MAC/Perforin domain-containing protein [Aspergillus pseudodeflectus]|uniref:MAC/Perforin domain-containing protein n=1 Tax=Aspergillus pseudodeflectus TaxID=176178 RepID=A0ABR4KSG8_9EURO
MYTELGETKTHSLKVESGTELKDSLDADASASLGYAGFAATGSVKYSYQTALSASKYYAVLSTEHKSFLLKMKLTRGTVDIDDGVLEDAQDLPDWPDAKKPPTPEVYRKYRDFFEEWGTYVVRSCAFGARYQLKLESHMTDTKSKSEFQTHISAEYNGICSVKADVGVATSSEYQKYLKVRKFDVKVIGGDSRKNADLSSNPRDSDKLDAWENSISNATALPISLKVISLGDVVKECKDLDKEERKALGLKLNNALSYFNSFRIVQGSFITKNPTTASRTYELSVHGYPGMEIYGSGVKSHNYAGSVTKKTPTQLRLYSKCRVSSGNGKLPDEFATAVLAYIKILAPDPTSFDSPPFTRVEMSLPKDTSAQLQLTNGPTLKAKYDFDRNREDDPYQFILDSIFEPGDQEGVPGKSIAYY